MRVEIVSRGPALDDGENRRVLQVLRHLKGHAAGLCRRAAAQDAESPKCAACGDRRSQGAQLTASCVDVVGARDAPRTPGDAAMPASQCRRMDCREIAAISTCSVGGRLPAVLGFSRYFVKYHFGNAAHTSRQQMSPDITARSAKSSLLVDRNAFERLLTDISTSFVNAPAEEIDGQITESLRLLVGFLGVDRSTLFQLSADRKHLENTHGWVVDGVMRLPRLIAQDAFPWSAAKILAGEIVSFATVDELPPEAAVDRAAFLKVGPRSNLSLPLVSGDEVLGALTFGLMREERQWPVDLQERLAVVAHVFANASARKRSTSNCGPRMPS